MLDQNIVTHDQTTPTGAPCSRSTSCVQKIPDGKHLMGPAQSHANNTNNKSPRGRDAPNKLNPERGQTNGSNPSPMIATSTPSRKSATKSTQQHNTGRDLIMIYESEDEAKLEEDPTDAGTGTSRRRRTNNRDPGSTPSSKAKRRLMMEDETQPLGKIRKPSAQPDWMKGNTNTKKNPRRPDTGRRTGRGKKWTTGNDHTMNTSNCPQPRAKAHSNWTPTLQTMMATKNAD